MSENDQISRKEVRKNTYQKYDPVVFWLKSGEFVKDLDDESVRSDVREFLREAILQSPIVGNFVHFPFPVKEPNVESVVTEFDDPDYDGPSTGKDKRKEIAEKYEPFVFWAEETDAVIEGERDYLYDPSTVAKIEVYERLSDVEQLRLFVRVPNTRSNEPIIRDIITEFDQTNPYQREIERFGSEPINE